MLSPVTLEFIALAALAVTGRQFDDMVTGVTPIVAIGGLAGGYAIEVHLSQ
ncbi:MAG TPA: hypothetical protein VNS88_00720 [Nitrospiraceae bacterium]|nr:hypothetical protein [Nitrospiraceae bacterium]